MKKKNNSKKKNYNKNIKANKIIFTALLIIALGGAVFYVCNEENKIHWRTKVYLEENVNLTDNYDHFICGLSLFIEKQLPDYKYDRAVKSSVA